MAALLLVEWRGANGPTILSGAFGSVTGWPLTLMQIFASLSNVAVFASAPIDRGQTYTRGLDLRSEHCSKSPHWILQR